MSDRLTAVRGRPTSLVWALGILVAFAAAGAACGLVWRSRLDVPHGVVISGRWYPDPWDTGEQASFAATGWYVVIALAAGVALGLLAGRLSRAPELVTLGAVLLGSLLAAWLMLTVGLHGTPPDPQVTAAHAAEGTRLSGAISRPGRAAFVTWPLAAVVALGALLLVLPTRSATNLTSEE